MQIGSDRIGGLTYKSIVQIMNGRIIRYISYIINTPTLSMYIQRVCLACIFSVYIQRVYSACIFSVYIQRVYSACIFSVPVQRVQRGCSACPFSTLFNMRIQSFTFSIVEYGPFDYCVRICQDFIGIHRRYVSALPRPRYRH